MFYPKDPEIYDELWDVIAPGTVNKGDDAIVQDVFGFYLYDAVVGDEVTFIYRMRQVLTDKIVGTGEEILAGDRVYFVVGQDAVTANPAGVIGTDFYFCGWAKKDASATEDTVLINFDGTVYANADMV